MNETIANKVQVATWSELEPLKPAYALIANVDLVVIRWKDEETVSVLFGRCQHRGALMADGSIRGQDIICGVHNWDYSYKTGISSYNSKERLHKFNAWVAEESRRRSESAITSAPDSNNYVGVNILGIFTMSESLRVLCTSTNNLFRALFEKVNVFAYSFK